VSYYFAIYLPQQDARLDSAPTQNFPVNLKWSVRMRQSELLHLRQNQIALPSRQPTMLVLASRKQTRTATGSALAKMRRVCRQAEWTVPYTKRPGSFEAVETIKAAIDNWAECELGARDFFYGRPHSTGCKQA
jgi:hypothetical protein